MLTARGKDRLRARADNADARLPPKAIGAGCVTAERRQAFEVSRAVRQHIEDALSVACTAPQLREAGMAVRDDGVKRILAEWLRFPEVDVDGLKRLVPALSEAPDRELDEAVQDHRYAPYVARQQAEIVKLHADEAVRIPDDLDYAAVPGLSNEMVERLALARPATLAAAGRIRGVTPAALAAILVYARRKAA